MLEVRLSLARVGWPCLPKMPDATLRAEVAMMDYEKQARELVIGWQPMRGGRDYEPIAAALRAVAEQARVEEREACATIAQDRADWCRAEHQRGAHFETLHAHERSAEVIAIRIRARGVKP